MREQGSLLSFLSDPRLAPYAMGDIPAWLWSADATRILWGNPAAAAIFNTQSRIAWWEGPPFGGGPWLVECQGDAKALRAVLAVEGHHGLAGRFV